MPETFRFFGSLHSSYSFRCLTPNWIRFRSLHEVLTQLKCNCPAFGGVRFKMGVSLRRPLGSHTDCGRDARVPRGDSPNLDCTHLGCIQDFWRASRPILSATPGAGETPAILKVFWRRGFHCQRQYKKPSNPGGYAIVSDAPIEFTAEAGWSTFASE